MHIRRVTLHPEKFPTTEHYPFNLELLQQTPEVEFTTPVTFFVGENGTGKTTLLRAICRRSDIYIWGNVKPERTRRNPFEDDLYKSVNVEWRNGSVPGSYFGSDNFRQFANVVEEWAADDAGQLDYLGGKSLINQSHGQSLMSYFGARYKIKGIYFLDEPETALSPATQLKLLDLIEETSRMGHAQFIIATHSPILMSCPGARIFSFDEAPIQPVAYRDTSHYRVYKEFLMGQ